MHVCWMYPGGRPGPEERTPVTGRQQGEPRGGTESPLDHPHPHAQTVSITIEQLYYVNNITKYINTVFSQ